MNIRPLSDRDVEAVVKLWNVCGLTRPWNDPYKDLAFARGKGGSEVLVCEADGCIAATAMTGHDGHRGMLYYVAVDPALRRRGLGTAMVRAAEQWLAARGVWAINLLVRSENAEVAAFYERLGYEVKPVLCMARRIMPEGQAPALPR